jgi:hypothetical protein
MMKLFVYAKSPVSGAESTLEYLARYAYRVAIGDRRIKEITDDEVSFEYKDYRDGGRNKPMTLKGIELSDAMPSTSFHTASCISVTTGYWLQAIVRSLLYC